VGGRSQEIVYATRGGELVSLEPYSGRVLELYGGDGYATTPSRAGGSRSLAFSVLRGEGAALRGDAYSMDLFRGTRARLTAAEPGRVYLSPEFSAGRGRLLAEVYGEAPPNVVAGPASGADWRTLPGAGGTRAALVGPVWLGDEALCAWRLGGPGGTALVAFDPVENRAVAAYRPKEPPFGPAAYHRDSNTLVFAERPEGAPLSKSRIKLLTGTVEREPRGAAGLGLYDPALPLPALGGKMALMWTDGKRTGVGFLDPATWTFGKSGIETRPSARYPQVSRDGTMVAYYEGDGSTIAIRELDGGGTVRVIRDAQRPGDALARLREAGLDVPAEAGRLVRPGFVWRSFEDD
jgi:hypothetical protein